MRASPRQLSAYAGLHYYRVQAFTGLDLACLADLPQDVLEDGKTIAMKLAALEEKKQDESQTTKIAIRRKALLRVFFNL